MKFTTATLLATLTSLTLAAELKPSTLSTYQTWTGAKTFGVQTGHILKPNGRSTDITTLVTFTFPADSQGKTCELGFTLDAASTLSGTARFDVFTSLKPTTQTTTGWPDGNLRDQHLGRFIAQKPGAAIPDPTITNHFSFPCPYGQTLGGELVGAGDQVEIKWDKATAGLYIKY